MSTQLSLLVKLAKSDGVLDERELGLIYQIGGAHGMSTEEIEKEINSPDSSIDFENISNEDRFEILYNLVHLMKVDGKVFDEEILYCMSMAKKLGYPMEAVLDLYGLVHANVKLNAEIQKVKRKYLL